MSPLLAEFVGALVRWVLTVIGAALVARNVITPEQASRFTEGFTPHVLAAVSLVLPLAWSLWHKHRGQLLLRAARLLPAGADDKELQAKAREIASSGQ